MAITKTLIALFILMATIEIIVIAIGKILKNKKTKKVLSTYQRLDSLLTPAEHSFLRVLDMAIEKNTRIFSKVRVADIVTPKKSTSKKDWQIAFNKISAKHFDFVLCDRNNLSVKCVIELNDKSHLSKTRNERDIFLEKICTSVKLPIIQIPAKSAYSVDELKEILMERVK